jgi:hypothetical protein
VGSADEAEDGDPKQLLKTFQDDVPDKFNDPSVNASNTR